jgi:hypothetical protein
MTWSYTVSDLTTSSKDQVRFLIGDTIANDPQLQDEEINFALTIRGSVYGTAAQCCLSISAQLSRKADTTTGELRTLYSSQAKAYQARAAAYEVKSSELGGALPLVGGISYTDKENAVLDQDRVAPEFVRNITDNTNQPIAPAGNETDTSTNGPNVI